MGAIAPPVALLTQMLGDGAAFRDGQWEAIDGIVNRRERLLVVQRTGWGKSIVYFLATKLLRDGGAGPTLLVSPLLSLMRNQQLAAERLGLRSGMLNSENRGDWEEIRGALARDELDLLMVAPERLGNTGFISEFLPAIQGHMGLFVVDEAHCISDWGHDFRPDYRRIVRVLRLLPHGVPVLCTTATANDRVVQDVLSQIAELKTLRGPLVRRSLKLYNIQLADQADRLAWLAQFVPQLPGSGIIYTLTVQDAHRVASWLQTRGIAALEYFADLEPEQRITTENKLLNNEVKALVATVALGMGFDKPDLGFVVHFQRPGSVVAYYQQVGRAGRAVDVAYGILLSGREDDEISEYFIRTAFPPLEVMQGVLRVAERANAVTIDDIGAELNCGRGAIEKALKLLEVDGAMQRDKTGWSRTANRWEPDIARMEQITRLRRAEVEEMQRYAAHTGCLMEFLARSLDDPGAAPCGQCMNCTGQTRRRAASMELAQDAAEFLRGSSLVLDPRVRWPRPTLTELRAALPLGVETGDKGQLKTTIPENLRLREGRALSVWDDAGWGREIKRGKYEAGEFSDALVKASAKLIREQWKPDPPIEWVTCVPSLHRPELVQHFALALARELELPFHAVLRKVRGTRPQKEMENSVQQIRNLLGAFAATARVPGGPVLLVDDVVDSGWTLTLLGLLLQERGSGPVFPFVLARASPRGS